MITEEQLEEWEFLSDEFSLKATSNEEILELINGAIPTLIAEVRRLREDIENVHVLINEAVAASETDDMRAWVKAIRDEFIKTIDEPCVHQWEDCVCKECGEVIF
jgi:hypothetical protein